MASTPKKALAITAGNLLLVLLTLVLSIVGYGWMSTNRQVSSRQMELTVDVPLSISFNTYYYDREQESVVRTTAIGVPLQAYDSIFHEYNENLEMVLELEVYGIPDDATTLIFTLRRTDHNDATASSLNEYSSSIIEIKEAYATTQQSTNATIWSSAVANASGQYRFTTKVNNQYQKTSSITISHTLTAAEKASNRVYVYFVFTYAEDLIGDYLLHHDIFSGSGAQYQETASFINDLSYLEVTTS